MKPVEHAIALALIYLVAGEERVAEYCLEHGIGLTPLKYTFLEGDVVVLGEDAFAILPIADATLREALIHSVARRRSFRLRIGEVVVIPALRPHILRR